MSRHLRLGGRVAIAVSLVVLATAGLASVVAGGAWVPGAQAAGDASAAGSPRLTRVERPRVDQVVGIGKLVVVLRTRASLGAMGVLVDGRSVERFLQRSARGYRGVLRLGQGLHYGVNELTVGHAGVRGLRSRRFIVARRNRQLLSMSNLRVGGRESPARVVVRAARRGKLQAWVNGHRVEHAFQPKGRVYVGRLGANDWVRPGRNRLVVLAHRSARSGRAAVHDVERATFRLRRGRVIAGAGRDRVFNAGGFIVLRGSAAGGVSRASGATAVEHRWKIVDQPPGPRATSAAGEERDARALRDGSGLLPDPHEGHCAQRLLFGRHGHGRGPGGRAADRLAARHSRRSRDDHPQRRGGQRHDVAMP